MFKAPIDTSRSASLVKPQEVKRFRPVELDDRIIDMDAAAAFYLRGGSQPRKTIELNLFDDVSFRAVLDRAEWTNAEKRTLVWSGHIENMVRGNVVLAVTGKIVSGTVSADDGRSYQVRNVDGPLHLVQEMDYSSLPPEAEPIPVFNEGPPLRAPSVTDDGSIIDVMVVYTAAARAAAGGTTQMNNLIALGIAETNQGYANSGVLQRVRLVHTEEVVYTESGAFNTDLSRLRGTSDSYMDNVHGLRNAYGADMVSLWVNSGDACGIAYLMTSTVTDFSANAFSVVRRDCATGYYSFAHEMGHNQGSQHDIDNASGTVLYPYSYGYQQRYIAPYFRTVMAYACSAGITCNRINYWSNPGVSYQGSATGTGSANNATSLNNTRSVAANWRQATGSNSISPPSANFGASGGNGSITVTATGGWTASSNVGWITINTGASGSGGGTVAYTVALNPGSSRTGTITVAGLTFTVTQSAAGVICSSIPIAIGQTVNGALTTNSCRAPSGGDYYAQLYTFTAVAGQQVAIALSSAQFDTYLVLRRPDNSILEIDDDGGSGLNSRIPAGSGYLSLPQTGTYTIEATTYDVNAVGSFTLSLTGLTQCSVSISPTSRTVDGNAYTGIVGITASAGCSWNASSNAGWLQITSASSGSGSYNLTYLINANTTGASRTGSILIGSQTFTVNQTVVPVSCVVGSIAPNTTVNGSLASGGCSALNRGNSFIAARYTFSGTAGQGVGITLTSPTIDTYLYLYGTSGTVIAEDDDSAGNLNSRIPPSGFFTLPATGIYTIEATTFDPGTTGSFSLRLDVSGGGGTTTSGLRFVPVSPPCRLMETRAAYAGTTWTEQYGPPMIGAGATRTLQIAGGARCNIPATAKAFVLNITLDTVENNTGPVDYVTIYPAGEIRPNFRTVRTSTGGYIANSAIVKSGTNGSVTIYSTNNVNAVLDISGYFTDAAGQGLLFYPFGPCRAVDTRGPVYSSLAPPFGNQRIAEKETRTLVLPQSPGCQLPAAAAYSIQLTLVPGELTNGGSVAFITGFPAGLPLPTVSNMNSLSGYVVANSAIVPARADGGVNLYAYNSTNMIFDVNGYFGPDDGTGRGLLYYPVQQCRLLDTQDATLPDPFGPPHLTPAANRTVPIPSSTRCSNLPSTARAWALNASVVPNGVSMPFLSMWPANAPWPNVSQLNAFQGQTLSNSGIVPAAQDGSIQVLVYGATHAAIEVAGYFGR